MQCILCVHYNVNYVFVSGDGRMDSPGHSAQYCSYTVMDNSSKKILTISTVDKRETGMKSSNMETKGFKQALWDVSHSGINVTEIVTDAHPQIGALMSK